MRWLLIVLLVSLAALLIAGAGMALHVWLRRGKIRPEPAVSAGEGFDAASGPTEEVDVETEI
jgi:hypothetical protein